LSFFFLNLALGVLATRSRSAPIFYCNPSDQIRGTGPFSPRIVILFCSDRSCAPRNNRGRPRRRPNLPFFPETYFSPPFPPEVSRLDRTRPAAFRQTIHREDPGPPSVLVLLAGRPRCGHNGQFSRPALRPRYSLRVFYRNHFSSSLRTERRRRRRVDFSPSPRKFSRSLRPTNSWETNPFHPSFLRGAHPTPPRSSLDASPPVEIESPRARIARRPFPKFRCLFFFLEPPCDMTLPLNSFFFRLPASLSTLKLLTWRRKTLVVFLWGFLGVFFWFFGGWGGGGGGWGGGGRFFWGWGGGGGGGFWGGGGVVLNAERQAVSVFFSPPPRMHFA